MSEEIDPLVIDAVARQVAERFRPRLQELQRDNERVTQELREARRYIHRVETRERKLREDNVQLRSMLSEKEQTA